MSMQFKMVEEFGKIKKCSRLLNRDDPKGPVDPCQTAKEDRNSSES